MRTNRRRHLTLVRKETWMRVKDPAALRRRRKNKRFSQEDLAHLVRRSQNTISLLELGKMKTLTEDLAIAIAARLECDWEDLFVLEESEVAPTIRSSEPSTGDQEAA